MDAPKRHRAPKISETAEHIAIAAYFRKSSLGGCAVAFHIKNDQSTPWQRMNAHKMGILPGVPDWCIIDGGRVGFIELKERGWKASKAALTPKEERQLETQAMLKRAGAWVEICETLDEVKSVLFQHGVPLRTESLIIGALRASLVEDDVE